MGFAQLVASSFYEDDDEKGKIGMMQLILLLMFSCYKTEDVVQ
jgi:hypothetical protein